MLPFELRKVLAECRPVDRHTVGSGARFLDPLFDRPRRPRLAQHHRRHALPDHALGLGFHEDRVVRVVVHVDEARSDRQARRIDPPRRRRRAEITDGRDASASNPHVRSYGRSALAIQYRTAGDQEVVRLLGRGASAGGGEKETEQDRHGVSHGRVNFRAEKERAANTSAPPSMSHRGISWLPTNLCGYQD